MSEGMSGVSKSLVLLVAMVLAAVALTAPASARNDGPVTASSGVSVLETAVLASVNQLRAKHGLRALRFSARLSAAADRHSSAMGAKGFFSHDSADGSAFWKRIRRYYTDRNYRYWSVGENMLWSSPDVEASQALDMWMKSPSHRANLLSRKWREIGLAAVHVNAAPGAFRGLDVTIVTADFGVRR
jgi:uncharacterized protein YkwD